MQIKIEELRNICLSILTKRGLSEKDALIVFNEFLDGEQRGRECHGFQAFPEFGAKLVDSEGEPKIITEKENVLYIDGKSNLGQIVCDKYVPLLIEKTKKNHIAMMGIKNMHSYLMPGTYTRMAAENNLVAFIFNYGGGKRIAPTGSIDHILGTNPIAIGLPGKDFPIVIDMATSKIAMMKVDLAKKLGKKIPEDTAIDKNGNLTTDPNDVQEGALLPFGDFKGYSLALMVEILTKTMFNLGAKDFEKDNRGFFFMFFDPTIFQSIDEFKNNVSGLVKEIKTSRKDKDVQEIFIPGEKSERTKQANSKRDYLDLDEKIINDIKTLNNL